MSKNENLHKAQTNDNDEFYTQYETIENELRNYTLQHFGKKVCSPCDEPAHSNFVRYYQNNFVKLRLQEYCASHFEGNVTRSAQCYKIRKTNGGFEEIIFPLDSKFADDLEKDENTPFEILFDKWLSDEMEEKIVEKQKE